MIRAAAASGNSNDVKAGRMQTVLKMWRAASKERQLPPAIEMFVYTGDKPRAGTPSLPLPAWSVYHLNPVNHPTPV